MTTSDTEITFRSLLAFKDTNVKGLRSHYKPLSNSPKFEGSPH